MIKKQNRIVLFLLFLIMLPNLFFIYLGEDSAVTSMVKRIVFSLYTLSLILLPLIFLKPKIYFLLLIPFLPFALIDLYVLNLTSTQSTIMHYYSFFSTNSNEAVELAKGSVGYIFLSILYVGSFLFFLYKLEFSFKFRKKIKLYIGSVSLIIFIILLMRDFKIAYESPNASLLRDTAYHFFVKLNKTFPFGSSSKLGSVYESFKKVNKFRDSMDGFSYEPIVMDEISKTIVLVIGETARRSNFQIYGYERNNNPNLSKESNLIPFTKFTTCANYTSISVSQIMSSIGPVGYKDVYDELGLIAAFKESGYKTYWVANQSYSPGTIFDVYSKSADVFKNTSTTLDMVNNDLITLPFLNEFIKDENKKKFIIVHSIGSHYRYNLRYPKEFTKYKPVMDGSINVADNGIAHKEKYINSYDNSILFTDYFLSEIIGKLKNNKEQTVMMYLSDHGENLYDDKRELFLHGTATPSKYELEIPMFFWHSDNYDKNVVNRLNEVKEKKLSSEVVFHTLSNLGGFKTKLHNLKYDLLSDSLIYGKRTALKADGSVMKID